MAFVKTKWADIYIMSRKGEDKVSRYLFLFLFYLCFVACAFVAGEGLFSIRIVTKSPLSLPTTKILLDYHVSGVAWQIAEIPPLLALTFPFIKTNQFNVYWLRFRAVLLPHVVAEYFKYGQTKLKCSLYKIHTSQTLKT